MASIRRVIAQGEPPHAGAPAAGTLLALKLASSDALALESMVREAETFELLQAARTAQPCPRLVDLVDENGQATGIVMEWCPTDMEQWWDRILVLPDALEPLCGALADVCRRIAEYHAIMASKGVSAVHADIKPRNAVLADDGRWLLTDFGAAKSRPIEQETWEATRLILGTENFIAPEMLFNARKHHPQAMDTWSVGATFFALLKMRRHRLFGHELPIDGTHSIQFRCQRMSMVTDLREREPALFAGKDLDPSAFGSPEQLPEDDRQAVSQALLGVFGEPDTDRERKLEQEILALLDRALSIDPARRFTRAEEMSEAFDHIVRRYWELEGSLDAAMATPRAAPEPTENPPMQHDPDLDEGRPTVVASDDDLAIAEPPLPEPVAPPPIAVGQTQFPPAGQVDEQTVLASPELQAEGFGAPEGEPSPPPVVATTLGPPPGAAPPVAAAPVAPAPVVAPPTDTLVPPADFAPPPVYEPPPVGPPSSPAPTDDRVVQLLEGIHTQLGNPSPPAAPGKVRLPFWLVLAIGLLIFCQALQFGLLVAIFFGAMGMSVGDIGLPGSPDIVSDDLGESPFELTAPIEDELAAASDDPDRSGEDEDVADAAGDDEDDASGDDEDDALLDAEPLEDIEEPELVVADAEEPELPQPVEEPAPSPPTRVTAVADVYDRNAPSPAPAPKPASNSSARPASAARPASTRSTSTSRSSSDPRSSQPATSTPDPTEAATDSASIEVLGATSYAVGPEGRRPCGDLAPGTYEIFAQPNDAGEYISLGVHMLMSGQKMQFRCGFGACRQIQ